MKLFNKIFMFTLTVGLLLLGILLFAGYAGLAIKVSNYVFFILTLGIVLNYIGDA